METKQLGTRISLELAERIDAKAKELGVTSSQLVVRALELIAGIDADLLWQLRRSSKAFNVPEALFIQNVVTAWLADQEAYREVYLTAKPGVELVWGLGSQDLFNSVKSEAIKEYEKELIKLLAKKEELGTPLEEHEKRLMIKYRIGKAWLESEEREREQEIKEMLERLKGLGDIGESYTTWGQEDNGK